jgi:hypothetical protein
MNSNVQDAQSSSISEEPSMTNRQRLCVEIALSRWREYFPQSQLSSKALAFIQQIRGDDGFQMGDRMLLVQSQQADSAHHREGTILR